jgi:hypothetical protein
MMTRQWMIAVAIIGLAMAATVGGYRLKRGQDRFEARARHLAEMDSLLMRCGDLAPPANPYHAALVRKSWTAALSRE